MSPLRLLPILLLAACSPWQRTPGRVPAAEAQAPLELVALEQGGPITWLELTVRAGSAHDPIGKEGLSWLTARLLREGGAGGRSPEEVEALLYALGTDITVTVDQELVSLRTRCLTEDVEQIADLMGDMVLEPGLDPAVAERLRGQAQEELLHGIADNDEALGLATLDAWLFTGHPYGHPPEGRAGVVETLTVADVQGFLAERYVRPAAALGVAGGMAADGQLVAAAPGGAAVAGLHARLTAGLAPVLYRDVTPRATEPVSGRSLLVVEKETDATGIHLGNLTGLGRDHPDWPAMVVAITALGEHRQSHGLLFRELRGERGLNYGDYAYLEVYRQDGWTSEQLPGTGRVQSPFYVWLRPVTADNGPFALHAAVALVESFVEEGLSEETFATMQAYLGGRIALWAASPGRRLGWAVEAAVMDWPDPIATLPAQIAALTREEVNAALRRHVQVDDLRIVVVTGDAAGFAAAVGPERAVKQPPASEEGTEENAIRIVYAGEAPEAGSVQADEDRRWATYDLDIQQVTLLTTEELFR